MPTQEERITTLEQNFASFQREIVKQGRRTDEDLTMLLGIVQEERRDSRRVVTRLDAIEERLDGVEVRLSTVEVRLSTVEARLSTVEADVHEVRATQKEHTTLLQQILERLPNSR